MHGNGSERPNWLSESEGSEGNGTDKEGRKTPTRETYGKRRNSTSVLETEGAAWRSHQANESISTIRLDTLDGAQTVNTPSEQKRAIEVRQSPSMDIADSTAPDTPAPGKPLPQLPRNVTPNARMESETHDTPSPARPRPSSIQSFQRPKKKVIWKGKTCIIALPLADRESSGLPPLLSAQDVRERVQSWISSGYSVDGFSLSNAVLESSPRGSSQSRSLFPDPSDMVAERETGHFPVHIHDQAEWEAWVEYLKEEKLRALGVTPSSSEIPQSTRSPFSATLSRASSTYPSLTMSPPIPPSSAASNSLRASSKPFSPTFNATTGMSSQAGSVASSQYGPMSGTIHAHKQSMAYPHMNARMTSPFDYQLPQHNSFGPGMRSPSGYGRPNSFSPPNTGPMQSLGEVLSPAMPPLAGANNTYLHGNHDTSRQDPQSYVSQHQPQYPIARLPLSSADLPRTPTYDLPSRLPLEIAHPTPRSHRHNLSAALQKEIEDAEAALESRESSEPLPTQQEGEPGVEHAMEPVDESIVEDLPILKRPEIDGETDDKSDIETNPSIAASPLLLDEKNTFANLQTLKDVIMPQNQPKHKAQPSNSRLNVDAKEFSPVGNFSGSNFTFGNTGFPPFVSSRKASPTTQKPSAPSSRNVSSKFNVEAPAFSPTTFKSNPDPSSFQFSSATFNVAAPDFNPSSLTEKFAPNVGSAWGGQASGINSIFGNVVIDSSAKATRRSSKALPIIRPRSNDSPQRDVESEENESGPDGRPSAPIERQKRARRTDSDGDRPPVYADSAPFNHSRILSEINDEAEAHEHSAGEEPVESVDARVHVLSKEGSLEQGREKEDKTPESADEEVIDSPLLKDEEEAIKFSEARPRSPVDKLSDDERVDDSEAVVATQAESEQPEAMRNLLHNMHKASDYSHKPKSSLSARAKSFELTPADHAVHELPILDAPVVKPRKSVDLGVTRFAPTPSPPISPPVQLGRLTSPPQDLYQYIKAEDDVSEERTAQKSDQEMSISSMDHSVVERPEQQHVQSIDEGQEQSITSEPDSDHRDPMPSYEEIDAVMKQFEDDPELGIERYDTPVQSTPLVNMRLPPNLRSDAPSPSPRRAIALPPREQERGMISPQHQYGLGIGVHRLNRANEAVSDWNDAMSPGQEDKLEARAQFFDGHVNDLVDGILENRLGPLEHTLQTIQQSLALIATKPRARNSHRSASTAKESDADDEEEYDASGAYADYRARSPDAKRRKSSEKIKAAVAQVLAAYQPPPSQSAVDLSEIHAALTEVRQLVQQVPASQPRQVDVKTILEDVISTHPRLRGQRVQQDHEASGEHYKLQVNGLESMLKAAEECAQEEARMRRKTDDELAELRHRLRVAEEEAAQHRESSEEAQNSLMEALNQKEAWQDLESEVETLTIKNAALEDTLEEYRVSSDQWRDEICEERSKNKELHRTLGDLREQLEDRMDSRRALRSQIDRLRAKMTQVVEDVTSDQVEWQRREHELVVQQQVMQSTLEQEVRRREKLEIELGEISKQHQEHVHITASYEIAQQQIQRLQGHADELRSEVKIHQDTSFRLERELAYAKEDAQVATSSATAILRAELDGARFQLDNIKSDAEAQIARLQNRLDNAELDFEDQKAKYDTERAEIWDAHNQALREANEKRETALEEQRVTLDKKLTDLRERHTRALHNSSDDRHRLEHHLNEQLSLRDDKVKHLEGKMVDLEERLEITKSAARAAVEAATAKGINLPTPAPSVIASPPQRAASASIALVKGSYIPEKISPQALRESIMVLQDQLQNREQRIEKLEAELAAIDKDAPNKVKDRETEISWLRELLGVRMDDLEDIVNTLSQTDFDRESVKDASIRLRANLQMEQQLRERAAAGGLMYSLPSLSSITQSPRALPMAAAAAWGNWRKARDTSFGALSDLATNLSSQTPSKSAVGSPVSFLSGIMTPPSTSTRTPIQTDSSNPPPTMRPLAAAAAARKGSASTSEARPLRAYNSQPRSLASRAQDKRPESAQNHAHPEPPSTPIMTVSDGRDSLGGDLTDDLDDDASPLENKMVDRLDKGKENEPFDITQR